MSEGVIPIEYPKDQPPKGKKWWWRPTYSMGVGGAGGWRYTSTCSFCHRKYENQDVPDICECGARKVKPEGQCGLVDESYNEREIWA